MFTDLNDLVTWQILRIQDHCEPMRKGFNQSNVKSLVLEYKESVSINIKNNPVQGKMI